MKDFRQLSDWLDGEGQRPENMEQEQQLLSALGDELRAAPSLPADFADLTAEKVLSRLEVTVPTTRQRESLLARLFPRPALDAVSALLQRRVQEDWLLRQRPATVLAALAVPAMLLGFLSMLNLQVYLVTLAIIGVLVLPYYLVRRDVVLGSLRRGRLMEDLLASKLSARSLVDGFALFSVWTAFRAALPVAALLLIAPFTMRSHHDFVQVAWSVAAWLPLTLLVVAMASYLVQMRSVSNYSVELALFWALPALMLASWGYLAWGWSGLLPGAVAAMLWLVVSGRELTVWLMEGGAEETPPQFSTGHRNPWLVPSEDNPVVVRETARLAGITLCGWWGLLLRRALYALPSLFFIVVLYLSEPGTLTLWKWFAALAGFNFVRCASTTVGAVVREREGNTLDSLIASGLGYREFLRGWLKFSLLPAFQEWCVLAALTVPHALLAHSFKYYTPGQRGDDYLALVLGLMAVALAGPVGTFLGLGVSTLSSTVSAAQTRLVGVLLLFGVMVMVNGYLGSMFLGTEVELLALPALMASFVLLGLALWWVPRYGERVWQFDQSMLDWEENFNNLGTRALLLGPLLGSTGLLAIMAGVATAALLRLRMPAAEFGYPLLLSLVSGLVAACLALRLLLPAAYGAGKALMHHQLGGVVAGAAGGAVLGGLLGFLPLFEFTLRMLLLNNVHGDQPANFAAFGLFLGMLLGTLGASVAVAQTKLEQDESAATIEVDLRPAWQLLGLLAGMALLSTLFVQVLYGERVKSPAEYRALEQRVDAWLAQFPEPQEPTGPFQGGYFRAGQPTLEDHRVLLGHRYLPFSSADCIRIFEGELSERARIYAYDYEDDHDLDYRGYYGDRRTRRERLAEKLAWCLLRLEFGDRIISEYRGYGQPDYEALWGTGLTPLLPWLDASQCRNLIATLEGLNTDRSIWRRQQERLLVEFRREVGQVTHRQEVRLPGFLWRQFINEHINESMRLIERSELAAAWPHAPELTPRVSMLTTKGLDENRFDRNAFERALANLEGLRVSAALQAYKLEHSAWPPSLEALQGDYLSKPLARHLNFGYEPATGKIEFL